MYHGRSVVSRRHRKNIKLHPARRSLAPSSRCVKRAGQQTAIIAYCLFRDCDVTSGGAVRINAVTVDYIYYLVDYIC